MESLKKKTRFDTNSQMVLVFTILVFLVALSVSLFLKFYNNYNENVLYAHTQDKPRLELAEKIEANFYTQDLTPTAPQQPPENKQPEATKITGKAIFEAIRLMDAEERRELTRVLFA